VPTSESLTLASRLDEINRAAAHVHRLCTGRGIGAPTEHILVLILEELITNSVKHGRPPPDAPIHVTLTPRRRDILIHYEDACSPFDPTKNLPPDMRDAPLEERPLGGLGWPLILHYCAIVSYERIEGGNRLILSMTLPRPADAE
jgi:serine/threonine-protein kinase RsbW/sigma-B regulation protein RsbU (phosphoserine phosphatase)